MTQRQPPAQELLHEELGAYSHARVAAGPLVVISGQVPLQPDGSLAGTDADTQSRQVIANLVAALRRADAGPEDVVKLTAYLTDRSVAAALGRARDQVFSPPYPTSTVVVVDGLLSADWLLEVEALAVRAAP